MPESSPAANDLVSEILALIGRDAGESTPSSGDLFARATKKQLLDCAARLGLTGVSKLSREDLAGRIEVAVAGLSMPETQATPDVAPDVVTAEGVATPPLNGGGRFPHKYDLGPQDIVPMPTDIPWGYGYDRITAMAVDPMRLYVYWEATDNAIAAARAGLGAAGERAWLNVRVYDITGRLFDGTNAHSYFDHRVERHERQWFFGIDKPTSVACAEVGLRSEEGYFVKIARSGRVEFPRNEPVGGGRRRVVERARRERGRRFAGGAPGARGVGPGPAGGGVGAPGGGGDRAAGQCGRLARMDRGRRLPGPARPAPVRPHLAEARVDRGAMDQRLGQDRVGRSRVAHRMGVGPVHLSARRPRGAASRSRTTARCPSAPRADARM